MNTNERSAGRRVQGVILVWAALACSDDSRAREPSALRDVSSNGAADAGALSGPVPSEGDAGIAEVDLTGIWLGTLPTAPTPIRLVFNLERAPDGGWTGTADSPDQAAFGLGISSVEVDGDQVTVRLDDLRASFTGQMSSDGGTLSGIFEQGGASFPLTLERQSGPIDYRRPQDPIAPFPYNSLDVSFASAQPGVTLAGTLTWPEGAGPFPAVVLITGSGPQNRNEDAFQHRPFLVLADALTRAGVAVLRYDDRGVGQSTGDFAAAIIPDFAQDTRGAIRFLREQSQAPVGAIGLVGHSEGGLIAPLVADGNADVRFLVLLAGPAVDGKTLLISQARAIGAAAGDPPAVLDAAEAAQRALYACVGAPEQPLAELDACLVGVLSDEGVSEADGAPIRAQLEAPWLRWFLSYDPAPVLRRTLVPVLALNGSLDLQVLASVNVPAFEAAFQEAENERASVFELEGLNHFFQHATTGSPDEYVQIEETMAPAVLAQIAEWIVDLAPADSGEAPDGGLSDAGP